MLQSLYIFNFVLIDELHYEPHAGFSVVTGETGAGKSIILGALDLLTGKRAESNMLRSEEKKCIIEGVFTLSDPLVNDYLESEGIDTDPECCIIRRELMPNGKSRAFVNDTPTSLAVLKQLGEWFIDIHSQHKNLLLSNASFQLDVLDILADNATDLTTYRTAYREYKRIGEELIRLKALKQKDDEEQDYLMFQYKQLDEAKIQIGELACAEEEAQRLTHAQDIKLELSQAYAALSEDEHGALSVIRIALETLRRASKYLPEAENLRERLQSCRIEMDDIASVIDRINDSTQYDPERLAFLSARIDLINILLNKHHAQSEEDLIALRNGWESRLSRMADYDEEIARNEKRLTESYQELQALAEKLHLARLSAGKKLSDYMVQELKHLAMPYVQFVVELSPTDTLMPDGGDAVVFLFSANPDRTPEPVADIASGGEIARLMLCLKALLAEHKSLPTILFDEIDTGVSGDTAEKIAHIMRRMGGVMQVIAVTHLPQIAAAGEQHYFVYKEVHEGQTHTDVRLLSDQEHIEEVARIQSGSNLSSVAIAAAKELIKKSKK